MDDIGLATAGLGLALLVGSFQWRRAVRRRLQREIAAGLGSPDPRERREAVIQARRLGERTVLGWLAAAQQSETDPDVLRAILDALALHRWSPMGASALAQLVADGTSATVGPGLLDGALQDALGPLAAGRLVHAVILDGGSSVGRVVTEQVRRLGLAVRPLPWETTTLLEVLRSAGRTGPGGDDPGGARGGSGRGPLLLTPTGISVAWAVAHAPELRTEGFRALLPERTGSWPGGPHSGGGKAPRVGAGPLVREDQLLRCWDRKPPARLPPPHRRRLPCVVEAVMGDRGVLGASTVTFLPERAGEPAAQQAQPVRAALVEGSDAPELLAACLRGSGYRGPLHALTWVGGGRPTALVAWAAGFSPALEVAELAGAGLVGTWCAATLGEPLVESSAPTADRAALVPAHPVLLGGRARVQSPVGPVPSGRFADREPGWRGPVGQTTADG